MWQNIFNFAPKLQKKKKKSGNYLVMDQTPVETFIVCEVLGICHGPTIFLKKKC